MNAIDNDLTEDTFKIYMDETIAKPGSAPCKTC